MTDLEEAGWKKAQPKKSKEITQLDIKSIFKLVDVDCSGWVSRKVAFVSKYVFNLPRRQEWLQSC